MLRGAGGWGWEGGRPRLTSGTHVPCWASVSPSVKGDTAPRAAERAENQVFPGKDETSSRWRAVDPSRPAPYPAPRCRVTAASWASREVSGRESPHPGASRGRASRLRWSPGCAGAGSRTSCGEDLTARRPPRRDCSPLLPPPHPARWGQARGPAAARGAQLTARGRHHCRGCSHVGGDARSRGAA